ncbi:fumarylacetoacetate hydrolase family protein [Ensifer adhaerens]|uniref:fumarylacetoacetate hydrolase family protein n=1 Tax=Ensifer adhaerens TaxID=106592 RepID=UPI000FD80645|nr:fumarylacetoacetate hydrolase family protein [Ensifer adhaerens]MDF8357672.1 fumarylacetoacetate hydrolase family protein [Ensifer adhaerens]THA60186.1 FAA hydrolase family protein [Ensifer adhaerens]
MRFVSYQKGDATGVAVQRNGEWRDLGEGDLLGLIRQGKITDASALGEGGPVDVGPLTLLPPLSRPPKILCVGLNYVDHAAESPYKEAPSYPAFFPRFATTLIGHGQSIIRPFLSEELDFEGELVAVIGKGGRHIEKTKALDHVAGYSIFNEGSIRDYQFKTPQWTVGKNFDGTGAFGPAFVTADELPAGGSGLKIETRLNGKVVQSANTSDMIFSVADLVSIASQAMTLEVGDVIVTGTPAGIGWARKPPLFMKEGDICEVEIEGIGVLRNPVRDERR